MEYRLWKKALEHEVLDLHLTATQWLQLLDKRTTGIPNGLIKQTRIIQLETSPEQALQEAWDYLNELFVTQSRPAQTLMQQVLQGPKITHHNPDGVFSFANSCKAIVTLKESSPEMLIALQQQTSFDTIINRLDDPLRLEWHRYRRNELENYQSVPFPEFAAWTRKQARVALDEQNTKTNIPKETRSQQDDKHTHPPPRSGNHWNRSNQQGNRSPNLTRRSSYSKEYNVSQRTRGVNRTTYTTDGNRRYTPQLNSSGRSNSEFERPLHESTRASSPDNTLGAQKIIEMRCAWCLEQDRPHRHPTEKCGFLPHANRMEKWKVIYKHQVCSICLGTGHHYSTWSTTIPACATCNYAHHKNIGCRPAETISNKRD